MKTKQPQRNVRFESQRSRILLIVVGCFLISLTFLVSSRPDAGLFRTFVSRGAEGDASRDATRAAGAVASGHIGGEDIRVDVAQQGPRVGGGDTAARRRPEQEPKWNAAAKAVEKFAQNQETEKSSDLREPVDGDGDGDGDGADGEENGDDIEKSTSTVEQTPVTTTTTSDGPLCDDTDVRSTICNVRGDIRIHPNASTVTVVGGADERVYKVRPYPRKGDENCLSRITEVTVKSAGVGDGAPQCTKTHDGPAVVFSIGGYTGNIFHDFSDVIVPLFNTVNRYNGDVHLVILNVASWWLVKYDRVIRALSKHPPIDFGNDGEVHCFKHAIVSLYAHRELIIEPDKSADKYTSLDFTRFVRSAFLLRRDEPIKLGEQPGKKPRLLIISRRGTRLLTNLDELTAMAVELGFEIVVNEADVASDLVEVGGLINSCDVMIGVHGAGLTNMMFLPPNATMIQIVPWGGLQWIAMMDYGEPAMKMGLKYIQYEIAVDESSLTEQFPRDHAIFTNPTSLHKNGFGFIKTTIMDGQNIKLDLKKFKNTLTQALENLMP